MLNCRWSSSPVKTSVAEQAGRLFMEVKAQEHDRAGIPTSLAGIARDLNALTRKMLRLMLLACPVAKTCAATRMQALQE